MLHDLIVAARRPVLGLAWLMLAMVAPMPGLAQEAASDEPTPPEPARPLIIEEAIIEKPEPKLAIDFDLLLLGDKVLPDTLADPVWEIKPNAGRRLVLLPLIVEPMDEPAELSKPSIGVRGGRFIAWHIAPDPEQDEQAGRGRRGQAEQFGPPSPAGQQPGAGAKGVVHPDGAPNIAREVLVMPNGMIRWELDRAFGGLEVQSSPNDYTYKIRSDLLAQQRPERARVQRGSNKDARALREERLKAEQEYREKMLTYRQLADRVRALPDSFQRPMPSRMWAVYEVVLSYPTLTITGPDPLPWELPFADLETLRGMASRSGSGELRDEDYAKIREITSLAQQGHPYSDRLLASGLADGGWAGRASLNDPLYRVLQRLTESKDDQARRTVLTAIATTVPPTQATLALMRDAAPKMDVETKLLALKSVFSRERSSTMGLGEMIETANRMLVDEAGPPTAGILDAFATSVAGDRRGREELPTEAVSQIRFEDMPKDRLDEAIAYAASAAGTNQLAEAWLNHRLLGSPDPEMVQRTLRVISQASAGQSVVGPVVSAVMNLVFTPPADGATRAASHRIDQGIPLDSTSHNLFLALNAGDRETRRLAWAALRHFEVGGDSRQGRPRRGAPNGDPNQTKHPLDAIIDAALGGSDTPDDFVFFLSRQPDRARATAGLLRVLTRGDEDAQRRAARELVGSGRDLAKPLRAEQAGKRALIATQLYLRATGEPEPAAGLLASDDTSRQLDWFAKEVAEGRLPSAAEWAAAVNNEDTLLAMAGSADQVLAGAAVAALVGAAGGDAATTSTMIERFTTLGDRTIEAVRTEWASAKRDIYASRLEQASGTYKLRIAVAPPEDANFGGPGGFPGMGPDGMPADDAPPALGMTAPAEIVVGIVSLKADGNSVMLANGEVTIAIPEERLAVRIGTLSELKNFPNKELAELPLEQVQDPVDLLPQEDGSWRGSGKFRDGRTITVILEPVAEE